MLIIRRRCWCTFALSTLCVILAVVRSLGADSSRLNRDESNFWNAYRIGDGIAKQHDAPSCGQYPNSIVCSYHQKTEVANDMEALIDVLSEFEKKSSFRKVPQHAVVVHVRLGDGLCTRYDPKCQRESTDIPNCWERHKDCWYDPNSETKYYAYPKEWYEGVVSELRKSHYGGKAIIVADKKHWTRSIDPRNGDFSVDEAYIESLAEFLRLHDFEVYVRQPNSPDQDFLYLCSANTFVQGGGGFSKLVASVVRKRGGTVHSPANDSVS